MILSLILNLFYVTVAVTLIYVIGKFILGFFAKTPRGSFELFINYIVGILVIVFVYSVIKSKLNTINIALIPIFGVVLFIERYNLQKWEWKGNLIKKDIILSLTAIAIIFLFQCVFYFDIVKNGYRALHSDQYAYSHFTNSLKYFGKETTNLEFLYFFPDYSFSLKPYHYAELWITSFFSQVFNISTINAYFLIMIPIVVFIYFIGIFAVFENSISSTKWRFIISIFLVFLGGLYFSVYDYHELTNNFNWADNSILSKFYQKVSFIYVFLLLSFNLLSNKKYNYFFIVLSIIPLFSFTYLPAIIGSGLLFSLLIFTRKKIPLTNFLLSIGLFTFVLVFHGLFYYFNSIPDGVVGKYKDFYQSLAYKVISSNFSIIDIKIFVGNYIYRFARPFIFYFPYLLVLFAFIPFLIKETLFLLIFICCGILASCLLYPMPNSSQFASMTMIVFNIYIILLINLNYSKDVFKKRFKTIISSLILLFISYSSIQMWEHRLTNLEMRKQHFNFMNKTSQIFDKDINVVLVFLTDEDYLDLSLDWWIPKLDILPLTQYTNKEILFVLGNAERFYYVRNMDIKHHSAPILFWLHKNHTDLFHLIKKFDIKFVYRKKGAIMPKFIENSAKEQIISIDKRHEIFVLE